MSRWHRPCKTATGLKSEDLEVSHCTIVRLAWADAERDGITGQAATPYLLDYIRRATGGRSLDANVALYRNNVALAAEVAAVLVAS